MKRLLFASTLGVFAFAACELEESQPRMGNFEVAYADVLRVYIGDTLVAEVADGEEADIDIDGQIVTVTTLCSDEGVSCPSESFWDQVAVDQPWGADYALLNFVNLSEDRGTAGQRLGGLLEEDGSFVMLSGLGVAANKDCAVLGVGTVEGAFSEDSQTIEDGVIVYEWAAGCQVGEVQVGSSLRLETDFTASRTGDYDVSSVTPEEPIDEEGGEVNPSDPDDSLLLDGGDTGI